jgi:RNA polymerase sigma-70 factor (ECF subfamily)
VETQSSQYAALRSGGGFRGPWFPLQGVQACGGTSGKTGLAETAIFLRIPGKTNCSEPDSAVLGNKSHAYNLFIRKLNTSVTTAASLSPQALFLQHEGWLRTVVRSRLQEADAVEDVMQNIALAIVRQRSLLADVNRIGAWLYQIAIRQVLMYRRTTGRRRKLHDRLQRQSPEITDIAEPLQVLLHEETREKVRQALLQLSELDRQVLMLKYSEGWTYREIADHLGVQEDTIEYRLMRARKSLRQHLRAFAEGT